MGLIGTYLSVDARPIWERRTQLRPRMRVPAEALPFGLAYAVLRAVRATPRLFAEERYQAALGEVLAGPNYEVMANTACLVRAVLDGEIDLAELNVAGLPGLVWDMVGLAQFEVDDGAYAAVTAFNNDFLNGHCLGTLLLSLVLDAAGLDPVEIDSFRGGDRLKAAYAGQHRTHAQKVQGPQLQSHLKKWKVSDSVATDYYAKLYIPYRFKHGGRYRDFLRASLFTEEELRDTRPLREGLRAIDHALGFPPRPPGRPHNNS